MGLWAEPKGLGWMAGSIMWAQGLFWASVLHRSSNRVGIELFFSSNFHSNAFYGYQHATMCAFSYLLSSHMMPLNKCFEDR